MKDAGEGDEGDEGDVTFFESKKVTKKPVVSFVGRGIVAAVYMKKGLESFGKASFPHASKPLFQFAKANPDGAAVRTAALVRVAFGWRRFCCGKNERVSRCGAGGGNASCGWLHLITASGGASPQGEAVWWIAAKQKPSP